jgi:hypothetical protein
MSQGQGSTAPEVCSAHSPANISSTAPLFAGSKAYLKSSQTGMYCRVASVAAASTTLACKGALGLLCDQAQPVSASPLTVTPTGLTFMGMSFVASTNGLLILSSDPAGVPVGTAPSYTFPTASIGRRLSLGCDSRAPSLL